MLYSTVNDLSVVQEDGPRRDNGGSDLGLFKKLQDHRAKCGSYEVLNIVFGNKPTCVL